MPIITPDVDRLRRLWTARLTGRVPADLVPWLLDQVGVDPGPPTDERSTPVERLADQAGDEIARVMAQRGVSQRTLGSTRRSVQRALAGEDVRLSSIATIADVLGCDVAIEFVNRRRVSDATSPVTDATPSPGCTLDVGENT